MVLKAGAGLLSLGKDIILDERLCSRACGVYLSTEEMGSATESAVQQKILGKETLGNNRNGETTKEMEKKEKEGM